MVFLLKLIEKIGIIPTIKAEQILRLNEDKAFDHHEAMVDFGYIPKTFEDEQKNPLPLSATFGTMFRGRDAWAHNNDLSSILDAEKKDRLFNH